ncbi:transposase [Candidatus Vondammii sp. HM_W22]|uniref:transposase n=1 Tax=Candidatus Vondammii sp. HM_W22 TaxID=2687299 RepID=UPI00403D7C37
MNNLRVHHTKKVKRWLSNRAIKRYMGVFFLPTYSSELNSGEYLNCDLKTTLHSGETIFSVNDLEMSVKIPGSPDLLETIGLCRVFRSSLKS